MRRSDGILVCCVYQMQFNQTTANKKQKKNKQTNENKWMNGQFIFYTRVKLINAKMIGIRIDLPTDKCTPGWINKWMVGLSKAEKKNEIMPKINTKF